MNGPFDGPYCGHVPTANTSLHNISMDQMQMLMGVNTGAAIVKRQQQEDMAYLAALAVENANIAQNEYENGLYQGRQEGYQAALNEIEALKREISRLQQGLKVYSEHLDHANNRGDIWKERHDRMGDNAVLLVKILADNNIAKPPLYRFDPTSLTHIKS